MAKKHYKAIIVGAGPAGLFSAYQLTQNPQFKKRVLILEKGKSLSKRKKTETLCGVGGAGTFSDGKLHFTPVLSHEKLLDIFSVEEYQEKIDYVDKLFNEFGVESEYTPQNYKEALKLVKFCQRRGVHLYLRRCKHIGSDKLPGIMKNLVKKLKKQGVSIKTDIEVQEIIKKGKKISGIKADGKVYTGDNYIVAPGRVGAKWLQDQARKIGLDYSYQKVEIGVRVEFPAGIMEEHSKIMHENIYSVRTPTYDDIVRTFCPCPNGRVAIEDYGEYVSVNGYSNSNGDSKNSNFDLATEVQLTEPVENTTDYAVSIAKVATTIGGGKPLLQRLADLKAGRRSTWKRIHRSYVIPSLKEVTPGDISMALPHRTVTNLLEGLSILDRVLPGLDSGSTLIYAPEVKLRGNRIKINRDMQTDIKNLYVAGDGAGCSGNIVGAAVSGIFAAKGVINKEE